MLYGETAIDIPRGNQRQKIKNVFLVPHHGDKIEVYPPVIDAIREADHVIIGPGDLFTSIVPNFLVPGVKETLQDTGAEITYIVNIMTKFGETDNYTAADFVSKIEEYLNREINNVILNTGRLEDEILDRYTEQKARFVEEGLFPRGNKKVIAENILDSSGGIIRHSPERLAEVICKIIA